MKNLLFILNPCAGQRRANRFLPEILRLFNEDGWAAQVYVTGASGDARRFIAEQRGSWDRVVCAGGDGTLNETVSGVLEAGLDCPIGYIPCGTTNDYAASIGLSGDVLQAAQDALSGVPCSFDVGMFNGRCFVYTATCGAFARASYSTSQAAKNVLGHLAYILEGIKDVAAIKPIRMRIEADGQVLEDDFIFCSITNSTSVGGILKLDRQLVALNDGRFEVTLVRNPITPAQLSTILVSLSAQEVPNEMIHFFSAGNVKVQSDPAMEWTLDGERADEVGEALLENRHSAVRILLPRRSADSHLAKDPEGEGA